MSLLIFDPAFAEAWEKVGPYMKAKEEISLNEREKCLDTAQKAVYLFLCKVVEGDLDLQIQFLDQDYGAKKGSGETPYRNKMERSIRKSLKIIRSYRHVPLSRFISCISIEVRILKWRADSMMKKDISWDSPLGTKILNSS